MYCGSTILGWSDLIFGVFGIVDDSDILIRGAIHA